MRYFIGIDGGATRSSAALAGADGNIVSQKSGRALNYHAIGKAQCEKNLRNLLRPFFKKYKKVERVVMGLAGLDSKEDLRVYEKIAGDVLPGKVEFSLFNDTKTALEDACSDGKKPRLLIISGTGSNVYGEFGKKKANAIGGDFLLGDEGSAYWLGLRALKSVMRARDGRGKKTALEKLVLEKSGKKDFPGLLPEIYKRWHRKPQEFKTHIASFAMLFNKPLSRKDPLAREIIAEAARELALGAEAVIRRLGIKKEPLCVGFVGSTFKNPGLLPSLAGKIKKVHPRVRFVYNINPLQGAISLAIKHD